MLISSFFKIKKIDKKNSINFEVKLEINKDDAVFEGHFPKQPIVPGVYSITMVKEVVEYVLQEKLTLNKAKDIKFFVPIIPDKNQFLNLILEIKYQDGSYTLKAILLDDENVKYLKINCEFLINKML